HLVDLLDLVVDLDLIDAVDPVQYAIRLLVPDASLLLDDEAFVARLGTYDSSGLTWTWPSRDPAVDALQRELSALAAGAGGDPLITTFAKVDRAVRMAAGRQPGSIPPGATEGRPRMTEPWFC
ncbi:MAG TPA: CUAEP/CCAEP-tail radical SAM protein, partial [Acidimicrobiales bacterium]|nr:CUAEP/CCAEP-tail radical SAM protein [Acidimicrobiales bacterium]